MIIFINYNLLFDKDLVDSLIANKTEDVIYTCLASDLRIDATFGNPPARDHPITFVRSQFYHSLNTKIKYVSLFVI